MRVIMGGGGHDTGSRAQVIPMQKPRNSNEDERRVTITLECVNEILIRPVWPDVEGITSESEREREKAKFRARFRLR